MYWELLYRCHIEIIRSTANSGLRRNVIFFVVEKWTQYGLAGYFTNTASDIEWTKIHSHPKKAIFGNSRNNKLQKVMPNWAYAKPQNNEKTCDIKADLFPEKRRCRCTILIIQQQTCLEYQNTSTINYYNTCMLINTRGHWTKVSVQNKTANLNHTFHSFLD